MRREFDTDDDATPKWALWMLAAIAAFFVLMIASQAAYSATWLKQSTAVNLKLGPFVDDTDGKTAETSLTISQSDVILSKNGGSEAQKNDSSSATHDAGGDYTVPLNSTDTGTLGALRVRISESGALPVWQDYMVVPANVYDSLFSTDKLEVDVLQFGGTNGTSSGGRPEVNASHFGGTAGTFASGIPSVNVAQISGDATAADNAEAAFDGTGYNVGAGRIQVLDTARRTIFVATTGNNSNDGLTPATAKLTLEGAEAVAASGNRIFIFNGTYSGLVSWGVSDVTIEGQSRTGVVITHNGTVTMSINGTIGVTLKNMTITASAETGGLGVGLEAHFTNSARIESCDINGHFDAAQFNGSNGLYVVDCAITGTYDALNASAVIGVFERNRFTTTAMSATTFASKSAFRVPASGSKPCIMLRDNYFVALHSGGGNTGDLIACTVQGTMIFEGSNRFHVINLDAGYTGDMIGIKVGDSAAGSYCRINAPAFDSSTAGANDIYHVMTEHADTVVDIDSNNFSTLLLTGPGAVNNIATTAAMVNAEVEAGDVGTNAATAATQATASLKPTTPGRTLDVLATGEAGIDLGNVANQGTTLTLSGTTVGTASAIGAGGITASSLASGAITNAKFASGAIDATAIASSALTNAKFATGAISSTTLASGTITAASIAADAITDAKVASDVTIASVTGAVGSVTGAVGSVTGNVGGNVAGSVGSVTGAVGSVTGNVGGNVTGSIGSISGVTFPTGFSTLTTANIQSGLATSSALSTMQGNVTSILADTNELQTDWVNGGRLDGILDNAYQASVQSYGQADAALDSIDEMKGWYTQTRAGYLDNASAGALATAAALASVKTDTGTTLPAAIGNIEASVDLQPVLDAVADVANDVLQGVAAETFFGNQPPVEAEVDSQEIADAVVEQLPALEAGVPRVNFKPDPAFAIAVSRGTDGTYKCTRPIRLMPGPLNNQYVFIDMSPLFGPENYVKKVGTPTISGGSITTPTDNNGPRDTYAVVELDGTATAGEKQTVTLKVTMMTGAERTVVFDVQVFNP